MFKKDYMAISVAIQKGSSVYVYDDRNHLIFTKIGELYGFTSSTVSLRKGSCVYTYDERGRQKSSHIVK